MKPPYTPREIVLMCCLCVMLGAVAVSAYHCWELQREVQFFNSMYTNTIISLYPPK